MSSRHTLLTTSSCQSELITLAASATSATVIKESPLEVGLPNPPVIDYCADGAALSLVGGATALRREVVIACLSGKSMPADGLPEYLTTEKQRSFAHLLDMIPGEERWTPEHRQFVYRTQMNRTGRDT